MNKMVVSVGIISLCISALNLSVIYQTSDLAECFSGKRIAVAPALGTNVLAYGN